MRVISHIKKKVLGIPDSYGVEFKFIDGTAEKLELVLHRALPEIGCLEVLTKDNLWKVFPYANIKSLFLDKRYTELVEARQRERELESEGQRLKVKEVK